MNMQENRVGCFMITDHILQEAMEGGPCSGALASIMARCVILRAEHLSWRRMTIYHAWSGDFTALAEGEAARMYKWEMTRGEDGSYTAKAIFADGHERLSLLGGG